VPDIPSDRGQESGSPAHDPPGGTAPLPAKHKRSTGKKMLTPFVLAAVGLAMLLAAWLIYPSAAGNPTPGYSELILKSAVPVNYIAYDVNRVSAGQASMSVSVVLLAGTIVPVHAATLQVWLPIGDAFAYCHTPACHVLRVGHQETSYWSQPLTFTPSGAGPAAAENFTVKAPDFGATSDGVNASAAIPEVRYSGYLRLIPVLQAGYPIQSASQYDWTSFEPEDATSHSAVWQEDLTIGDTASRVAVGINHAGQAHNELVALIAGTLLALGGGAILSAIQEALHARD
jgi:hypothetical protein